MAKSHAAEGGQGFAGASLVRHVAAVQEPFAQAATRSHLGRDRGAFEKRPLARACTVLPPRPACLQDLLVVTQTRLPEGWNERGDGPRMAE